MFDFFPYRVVFYDQTGEPLYSNGKSDGSFFSDDRTSERLDDWIWQELENSPNHSCHFQIPSTHFDHILMHSYQALYDDSGQLKGVLEMVQNIEPLLNSYLENSAQALVSWSDVTSGPSSLL